MWSLHVVNELLCLSWCYAMFSALKSIREKSVNFIINSVWRPCLGVSHCTNVHWVLVESIFPMYFAQYGLLYLVSFKFCILDNYDNGDRVTKVLILISGLHQIITWSTMLPHVHDICYIFGSINTYDLFHFSLLPHVHDVCYIFGSINTYDLFHFSLLLCGTQALSWVCHVPVPGGRPGPWLWCKYLHVPGILNNNLHVSGALNVSGILNISDILINNLHPSGILNNNLHVSGILNYNHRHWPSAIFGRLLYLARVLYLAVCCIWPFAVFGRLLYLAVCCIWPFAVFGRVLYLAVCCIWPFAVFGHLLYLAVCCIWPFAVCGHFVKEQILRQIMDHVHHKEWKWLSRYNLKVEENCRFSTETFWRLVFSHEWFIIHLQRDEVELEMNSEPRVWEHQSPKCWVGELCSLPPHYCEI